MAPREIVCLTNGMFAENCYIVADTASGDAVLIDPGEEAELFLRRLGTQGWTLRAVWLTHAHIDHVAGVARVVRDTGVEVWLHPDDRELYDNVAAQAQWMGLSVEAPPPPDHALLPGKTMSVGSSSFEIRHVPGHSPGSVALVGEDIVFVGDALFAGSVGRVDLPGGDGETLLTSITNQLLTLPDEMIVYAGHGPSTTIGHERRTNPFLTGAYPLS